MGRRAEPISSSTPYTLPQLTALDTGANDQPFESEQQIDSMKALAHEAIHTTVADILGAQPRSTLLDVPAGEGALASRLLSLGFEVSCCDLHPEIFCLPEVEIKQGNLSHSLPYPDASFDYIVCIEGLEHIENPHQAIREFSRLIRRRGQVIISVPNILNIEERIKSLLFGYTSHFKPLSREHLQSLSQEFAGAEEVALHINPIGYAELRYLLEKYGFEIVRLYRDKPKSNLWAYAPLVGLIRLLNYCQSERRRSDRWAAELQSNEVLLGGNTLIMQAVKRD